MNGIQQILSAMPWYAWIAVIVLVGGIIRQVVSMSHKHRERMEMIRQGMDPRDYPKK
ncbi:hypothetical protein RAS2_28160 [Phycisphaerae bacterium RAS2]|nr:hypothetical protein RAS2_28160 [Phycisphaerae bacterium RAS2]